MQSRDEAGNIKQLTEVDFGKADELVKKIRVAEEKGAVSHTIAKLPKAGENIEINGLSYRVEFADFVRGKFTVKLICRDR
jgi:Mg2+/Co2+ transporter CorC